jgi:hypothetical protein
MQRRYHSPFKEETAYPQFETLEKIIDSKLSRIYEEGSPETQALEYANRAIVANQEFQANYRSQVRVPYPPLQMFSGEQLEWGVWLLQISLLLPFLGVLSALIGKLFDHRNLIRQKRSL